MVVLVVIAAADKDTGAASLNDAVVHKSDIEEVKPDERDRMEEELLSTYGMIKDNLYLASVECEDGYQSFFGNMALMIHRFMRLFSMGFIWDTMKC